MDRAHDVEHAIVNEARLIGELAEIRILLGEAHANVGNVGRR
jgi:hypothetical protein